MRGTTGGRFSIVFEAHALEVLEACQNTTAACKAIGASWDHASPAEAREFFLSWYKLPAPDHQRRRARIRQKVCVDQEARLRVSKSREFQERRFALLRMA